MLSTTDLCDASIPHSGVWELSSSCKQCQDFRNYAVLRSQVTLAIVEIGEISCYYLFQVKY